MASPGRCPLPWLQTIAVFAFFVVLSGALRPALGEVLPLPGVANLLVNVASAVRGDCGKSMDIVALESKGCPRSNKGLQLPAGKPHTQLMNMNPTVGPPLTRRGPAAAEARR